jgi:hypothetical protein
MTRSAFLQTLGERILVFDGAMGTSVQTRDLSADDFGGPSLEGCNDYLVLSRPDVIREIHASFLEVGCDVIETDTFRANRLSVAEYGGRALSPAASDPRDTCRAHPTRRWAPSVSTSWRTRSRSRLEDSSRVASTSCSSRPRRTSWS